MLAGAIGRRRETHGRKRFDRDRAGKNSRQGDDGRDVFDMAMKRNGLLSDGRDVFDIPVKSFSRKSRNLSLPFLARSSIMVPDPKKMGWVDQSSRYDPWILGKVDLGPFVLHLFSADFRNGVLGYVFGLVFFASSAHAVFVERPSCGRGTRAAFYRPSL